MANTGTGNPVPSEDVRDLLANAINLDLAINGVEREWVDRRGVKRPTIGGANDQLAQAVSSAQTTLAAAEVQIHEALQATTSEAGAVLAGLGYLVPIIYAEGLEVDSARFTVVRDGVTYAAVSDQLPFTTGADFDTSKWRVIQGVAGADLASTYGSTMVGFKQAEAAVPRSIGDKARDQANLFDFIPGDKLAGIVAGVSDYDATAAIQAALNEAGSRLYGADVHCIPGKYLCSDTLVVPDGVNLIGAGRGRAQFDASAVEKRTVMLVRDTVGTIIRGIKVTGSERGTQPANGSEVTVDAIRDSGCGLVFAGAVRGLIEDCIIENCGGTAGTGDRNGVAGVWLTKGTRESVVQKTNVINCRNGINEDNFFGAEPISNKILHNIVESCRFGVALDSGPSAVDTQVAFNSVKDCLQSGVDLNKAGRCRIAFNYIWGCGKENGNSAIFLYGTGANPALDVEIIGNLCRQNYGHGIKIGEHAYYPLVLGNRCLGNVKSGLLIVGIARHWSIIANHLNGNGERGLYVYRPIDNAAAVTTSGVLNANYMLQNGMEGMLLGGAAEIACNGNTIKDNSQILAGLYDGLRIERGTIRCNFTGNHVSGAKHRYGLASVDDDSFGNSFIGNELLAGVSGRVAFQNKLQTWRGNGDEYITVAGTPQGVYPYGSMVYNNGDQRFYIPGSAGWRYLQTLMAA